MQPSGRRSPTAGSRRARACESAAASDARCGHPRLGGGDDRRLDRERRAAVDRTRSRRKTRESAVGVERLPADAQPGAPSGSSASSIRNAPSTRFTVPAASSSPFPRPRPASARARVESREARCVHERIADDQRMVSAVGECRRGGGRERDRRRDTAARRCVGRGRRHGAGDFHERPGRRRRRPALARRHLERSRAVR